MKKVIFLIITVLMFSLMGCGSEQSGNQDNASNNGSMGETVDDSTSLSHPDSQNETTEKKDSSVSESNQVSEEEQQLQEDMDELEQIGDISVENGILTVSVTIPAEMAKGATQEGLDSNTGEFYTSAVLNEDGSVTYKMTKEQHRKMLLNITDTMESNIQNLINDENYSITGVKHNDDYTVFDVTIDGTELGLGDSLSTVVFYMYGGMYGIFSGNQAEHIVVNFCDLNGNIIETADSANAG